VFPILETKEIAKNVYLQRIQAPGWAKKRKAGQFLVLRRTDGRRAESADDRLLRRRGRVRDDHLPGGREIDHRVSPRMKTGDAYLDVVGPLGLPTISEKFGTVVGIGGGIGTAPLLPIATAIKEAGNRLLSIVGARTKDLLIPRGRDAGGLRRDRG